MDRRYTETANLNIVNMVEAVTGSFLSAEQRSIIVKGASEGELVNSGLEDTMIRSYHEIREVYKRHPKINSLRTAALVSSIDKIAVSYSNMGIWP
jgi:glutamate dehydrogenase (NAD(P)+)